MNGRTPLQHASVALGWPIGMGLASWRYLWRTTPVYRVDESVRHIDDPPAVPAELVDDRLLQPDDGVGPKINRRYSTRVCASQMSADQLITRIAENPNRVSPREVAVFRKIRGTPGRLEPGDEYLIRMPGPWDGPVRVVDRSATSFRFATLQGHLEAGQIEFRADSSNGHMHFEIESWASSGDRLSAFLYDRVPISKEVQLNLWTHFLERVVRTTRGQMVGGVRVHTLQGEDVDHGH